jgi:hypothetical protein
MKIYETVYIIYAYVCSRAACPAVQRSLHAGSSANARELAYGQLIGNSTGSWGNAFAYGQSIESSS